jgi:hypothetical protein
MSTVSLDGSRNEFYLDDETYAEIVRLVQANKQCTSTYKDRHLYTEDNPCVGRSICLEHLLVKQPHLVYAGSLSVDSYNRRIHRFVNSKGMIHTSIEDSDDEAKEDLNATLAYYGFTAPETVESRGKSVSFTSYYARIHGDLHNASVLVLSYNHYTEKVRGEFLLYKNGKTVPLNKRGEHKALYTRAEELVEACKDAEGVYHIGTPHSGRYDSDMYEVISQLESAMYDVTRKLQNGAK